MSFSRGLWIAVLSCFCHFFALAHSVHSAPMVFIEQDADLGACPNCFVFHAIGEITPQTPDNFLAAIEGRISANSGDLVFRQVYIDSPGGDLNAGLKLGRLFRKHNINVFVGFPFLEDESTTSRCLSACAYAFLGSEFKDQAGFGVAAGLSNENNSLGFHQFFDADVLSAADAEAFSGLDRLQDQIVVGVLIEYLIEMGVHTDLYTLASQAPPDQMFFPSIAEAERLGIIEGEDLIVPQSLALEGQDSNTLGTLGIRPFGEGLMIELTLGDFGQRFFCTRKNPGKVHIQILRHTEDGSTQVSTMNGSTDIRQLQPWLKDSSLVVMDPTEDDEKTVPAVYGGLYADGFGEYSFLVDFQVPLRDFLQIEAGDMFALVPNAFEDIDAEDIAKQGLKPGGMIAAFEVLTGGIPPGSDTRIFNLMEANCV